jgi:hypothetical protein
MRMKTFRRMTLRNRERRAPLWQRARWRYDGTVFLTTPKSLNRLYAHPFALQNL